MNIQKFIKTAITEIVIGVAEAREDVGKHRASVGSDKVYGPISVLTDTKGGIGVFVQ